MSFFYTAPVRFTGEATKNISALYIKPYFMQNWQLFAPQVPKDNYEYKILLDNKTNIELIKEYSRKHHATKIWHYGKTILGLYNWGIYLNIELNHERSEYFQSNTQGLIANLLNHLGYEYKKARLWVLKNDKTIYFTEWDE